MARSSTSDAATTEFDTEDRDSPPPQAGGSSGGGGGLTRVTVNLNRQAVEALDSVSAATGYSKTDTINRALQVYAIVHEIMRRNGGTLQVRHDDGNVERIYIL